MNNVVLIGRLTRDPELRFTASGKAVCTFSIAVNKPFSKSKEADFFIIVVWGKTAEHCANYLTKGRLVGIQGRLQSRSYTKHDEKRYVTEVVADQVEFLEWGNNNRNDESNNSQGSSFSYSNGGDFDPSQIDLSDFEMISEDEDIPF